MAFLEALATPIRARAKSPLYGSFILSWIIWNWRIFIALFFLDDIDRENKHVIEFIEKKYLGWESILGIPLLITLVFILILPVIDYGLMFFTEEVKRRKVDLKLKKIERHSVSGADYVSLHNRYEDEKIKIVEFENKNSELATEHIKLKNENKLLTNQVKESAVAIKATAHRKDMSKLLHGRWKFMSQFGDQAPVDEEIDITGKEYYKILANNSPKKLYDIMLYDCDIHTGNVQFVKCKPNTNEPLFVCELTIISRNRLEGIEGSNRVSYTRHTKSEDSPLNYEIS